MCPGERCALIGICFNEMFATREQLEWSTERVLSLNPRSRRARWQPGMRHSYSHPGYTLAGHVVEVATGRRYEDLVRERVFDPLGMRNASFVPTPAVEAELAVPYTGVGLRQMEHLLLHHRAGSHVYASPREMARVIELLSNCGVVDGRRVLPAAIIDRLEQGSTLPYPDLVPKYGLGLYVVQTDGVLAYTHGGWMPGHYSVMRYLPGAGAGLVLMTNEAWDDDVAWEIEAEIIAYLQRDVRPAVPLPRVELEQAELEALAGTYVQCCHEVEFAAAFELRPPAVVDVEGSDLRMHRRSRTVQLIPVGGPRFRRAEHSHPSVMFTTAEDGTAVLYDGWGFVYHERISNALAIACRVLLAFTFVALALGVLWPTIWVGPALGGKCTAGLRAWPCAGAWSVYLFVDRSTRRRYRSSRRSTGAPRLCSRSAGRSRFAPWPASSSLRSRSCGAATRSPLASPLSSPRSACAWRPSTSRRTASSACARGYGDGTTARTGTDRLGDACADRRLRRRREDPDRSTGDGAAAACPAIPRRPPARTPATAPTASTRSRRERHRAQRHPLELRLRRPAWPRACR